MQALMKALVRLRIAEGWEAWVAPGGKTLWAHTSPPFLDKVPLWAQGNVLHTIEPLDGELDVLDEVLREKVS